MICARCHLEEGGVFVAPDVASVSIEDGVPPIFIGFRCLAPKESERFERAIAEQLAEESSISFPRPWRSRPEFEPIEVSGQPLSEMIIQDRSE